MSTTFHNKLQNETLQSFRALWSFQVPPGWTFNNSTFCPHSVFVCSVWIAEQTAIISLYSINWLVFITETECVYCAVRTGSFYVIQVSVSFSRIKYLDIIEPRSSLGLQLRKAYVLCNESAYSRYICMVNIHNLLLLLLLLLFTAIVLSLGGGSPYISNK